MGATLNIRKFSYMISVLGFCTSCSHGYELMRMDSSSREGEKELVVNNPDGRRRVPDVDVTQVPHKSICSLILTTPNDLNAAGTGWLIGPNKVYTAGHCLYSHDRQAGIGWMKRIVVIPGRHGNNAPFGEYEALGARVHPKWMSTGRNVRFDMGAILLSSDVTGFSRNDYFQLNIMNGEGVHPGMTICGYPGDLPQEEGDRGRYQYMHTGEVSSKRDGVLTYPIDTYPGQSGSPVYNLHSIGGIHTRNSIGIHTRNEDRNRNAGVAIKETFRDIVKNWKKP